MLRAALAAAAIGLAAAPATILAAELPSHGDATPFIDAQSVAPGITGDVLLSCRVHGDGRLMDCSAETPTGIEVPAPNATLESAALRMAPLFRMPPGQTEANLLLWIDYPRWWRITTSQKVLNMPDLRSFYPPAARKAGVEGDAGIFCTISEKLGLEDCSILRETPLNHGFGDALLKAAPAVRLAPTDAGGLPVAGTKVRLSAGFRLPRQSADRPERERSANRP